MKKRIGLALYLFTGLTSACLLSCSANSAEDNLQSVTQGVEGLCPVDDYQSGVVRIESFHDVNGEGRCTGTLIDSRHVLTAERCTYNKKEYLDREDLYVVWSRKHDWESDHFAYVQDIWRSTSDDASGLALLTLDREVSPATAQSIPLSNVSMDNLAFDATLEIVGFGKHHEDTYPWKATQCVLPTTRDDFSADDTYFLAARACSQGDVGAAVLYQGALLGVVNNEFMNRGACMQAQFLSVADFSLTIQDGLEQSSVFSCHDLSVPIDPYDNQSENNNLDSATVLADLDQNNWQSLQASLDASTDADWYVLRLNDTLALDLLVPEVALSSETTDEKGATFEVCSFFVKDGETESAGRCEQPELERDIQGHRACCGRRNRSDSIERLRIFGVHSIGDDSGTLYIRVRSVEGSDSCGSYRLSFGDK
ncbi:MAG: trypsin-like serine protease [Myxococcales bacterium]|nr:MAG: trypsin-like serine protease [Myxococcales bacterium]